MHESGNGIFGNLGEALSDGIAQLAEGPPGVIACLTAMVLREHLNVNDTLFHTISEQRINLKAL